MFMPSNFIIPGFNGVTTFEWTKKLSPEALTLQNETRKNTLQQRIQN